MFLLYIYSKEFRFIIIGKFCEKQGVNEYAETRWFHLQSLSPDLYLYHIAAVVSFYVLLLPLLSRTVSAAESPLLVICYTRSTHRPYTSILTFCHAIHIPNYI